MTAATACAAPSVQLHLLPDGMVRACCRNTSHVLGDLRRDRLADIWNGPARRRLAERLAEADFSSGCEGCENEIAVEGRAGSYPAIFDGMGAATDTDDWPSRIEFNLSNRCNLQCVQCHGDLSSSIRTHREHRPPLAAAYGDEFFEDLREALPHLRSANFSGGEPFLAGENHRVWASMAELCPGAEVTICSNGTQWGRRVEQVLDELRPSMILSLDAVSVAGFESIRVGADHAAVFANVDRFARYAEWSGTRLAVNFCLMPQNVAELPLMVEFAEERGIAVNVSVVRAPAHCSVARRPVDEIRAFAEQLAAASERILPSLSLNRTVWLTEVARVRAWADAEVVVRNPRRRILSFPSRGDGPHDDRAARHHLAARSGGLPIHTVVVDADELVAECSPQLPVVLGVDRSALVGQPVQVLQGLVSDQFGAMSDLRILDEGTDRVDTISRFGDVDALTTLVALRDDSGWADRAELLVAFRTTSG